jgi:hypothetical protein
LIIDTVYFSGIRVYKRTPPAKRAVIQDVLAGLAALLSGIGLQ